MARPRKPARLLELKGAFAKDPQRRRDPEPQPNEPLGDAPGHLDAGTQAIWAEIASVLPAGVVGNADRLLVEMCSCLVGEFRRSPLKMQTSRMALLRSCLASLGMSPCDRAKLSIPERKNTTDPWDGFRKP